MTSWIRIGLVSLLKAMGFQMMRTVLLGLSLSKIGSNGHLLGWFLDEDWLFELNDRTKIVLKTKN
jgi:hypothetical protein